MAPFPVYATPTLARVTIGQKKVMEIFGTTEDGGANGPGTVFQMVKSGGGYTFTVIYSFTGLNGDGANPEAGVTLVGQNLFGAPQMAAGAPDWARSMS
jgi:hypothetical protein